MWFVDRLHIMLSAYTLEFLVGFAIYFLRGKISILFSFWMIIIGFLIFLSGMTFIKYVLGSTYVPGSLLRTLFFGFSTTIILVGFVKLEMEKLIKIPRLFVYLGDLSYTIYLLHVPFFIIFFKATINFQKWADLPELWYPEVTTTLAMTILLIVSSFHFKFIESPVHNFIRSASKGLEAKIRR